MAYANIGTVFAPAFTGTTAKRATTVAKPGFFARLYAAMIASREMSARREIARHSWLIEKAKVSRNMTASANLPF
jgi:hypothetical protein